MIPISSGCKAMFLICFDICDNRRLRLVAREMGNFGVRVQKSVFECYLGSEELAELQRRLARILDAGEDKIRYYSLCGKDRKGILIDGIGRVTPDSDFILV